MSDFICCDFQPIIFVIVVEVFSSALHQVDAVARLVLTMDFIFFLQEKFTRSDGYRSPSRTFAIASLYKNRPGSPETFLDGIRFSHHFQHRCCGVVLYHSL